MNPGLQRRIVTGSIMLATIIQALDSTIANVALPHMQGSFSASQEQIAWVLTSYIIAAAVFTPTTGFLASRFGHKRLLTMAIIGFTFSSMLCGAATSLNEIVIFRLLQGMFGAALVPLSQAILLDTTPREQHGSAMAIWGMGVMVGPILGPALGGWLTESYSWRWVFYINLPLGALALAGVLSAVPDSQTNTTRRFDWTGFALLSLAIASLQIMLDRGQSQDWFSSNEIVLEAMLGGIAFYLFIVHSMTTKNPFIPLQVFADRNVVLGLILITIVGVVLFATMALLPPFLETLKGYPVVTTGLVLAPRGMGTMVSMFLVGRLINHVDTRYIMALGMALTAYSLWEMASFSLDVNETTIILTGVLQGFGIGFVFVPLAAVTFSTLAPHLRTEAAALFSLLRNLGASVGISITQSMTIQYMQINHAVLSENLSRLRPMLRPDHAPLGWALNSPESLALANQMVSREAATIAYLNDFRFMMYLTVLAIPLLFLLKKQGEPTSQEDMSAALAD